MLPYNAPLPTGWDGVGDKTLTLINRPSTVRAAGYQLSWPTKSRIFESHPVYGVHYVWGPR